MPDTVAATAPATATVPVPAVLDLAMPRMFVLYGKNDRVYTLLTRRVTAEDWAAYYAAQNYTITRSGKDTVRTIDNDTPRRVLAERVINQALGYSVAGGGELMALPNWQSLLPLAHRLEIGRLLAAVDLAPASDDDEVIHPEGEVVELQAIWGEPGYIDDNGIEVKPAARLFTGLKHTLATPTDGQRRRFARESSRTVILGGSRAGTTQYPGAQPILAKLYDELVLSVEGYAVNAQPLTGRAQIVQEMDTHHKFFAALQVFQPATPALTVDAPTDDDLIPAEEAATA